MKRYSIFLTLPCLIVAHGREFDEELFTWSRTFAELMHLVNTSYYVDVRPKDALCKAMNAFVSFDPHSKFLDPKAYGELKNVTNGTFFGIGVHLAPKEPYEATVTITDSVPESPAAKAGIQPKDLIVALDNEPVVGLTIDDVTEKIKGPRGSSVHLTLLRNGKTVPVSVQRDAIKEHDAIAYYLNDQHCVYIALRTFTHNSAKHLEKALEYAQKKSARGLIIDVRDNSGGLLNAAVDCLALFVREKSTVVYTKNKDQKILETFATARAPRALGTLPIFILVNHQTASAAEIFAGALKQHPTLFAYILGTQTFGKGSVQPVFPLSNGCAVKLTHALYYLANGTSLQGVGIEPDFVIEKKVVPSDELEGLGKLFGHESKLHNSINKKNHKQKKSLDAHETAQTKAKRALAQDHHVQVSLALIELLDHARVSKKYDVSTPHAAYTFLFQHQPFTDTLDSEEIAL